MEAVILAGGFGTRLQSVVSDVPKPMAPVNGRPFLEYLIDDLVAKGIKSIILATGYKHEVIKKHFGNSYNGASISYSVEKEPLGTGGALLKIFNEKNCQKLLVVNGDTFFDVDIVTLEKAFEKSTSLICVSVKPMENFSRYGAVEFNDNGLIERFLEKKEVKKGYINAGSYIVCREAFKNIDKTCFSFEKEILEPLSEKGKVSACLNDGYFIDIGIPEDYERAQTELGKIRFNKRCLFLDRDGVINEYGAYQYKKEDIKFIPEIFPLIRQFKENGWLVVVVSNQAGIAKGKFTEKDYFELEKYMDGVMRSENAAPDAWYYCPYHEDGIGEYKKASEDRKPNIGMILKAQKRFNINLSKSYLIGDNVSDIACAVRAGIPYLQISSKVGGQSRAKGVNFSKIAGQIYDYADKGICKGGFMKNCVLKEINKLFERLPELNYLSKDLISAVNILCEAAENDKKILICGNGGSAADAEHISGELLKTFKLERPMPKEFNQKMKERFGQEGEKLATYLQQGIQALPLVSFSSFSTAFINDTEPTALFAQGVCSLGRSGDVLIAISTSGNSNNVVAAMQAASVLGLKTIALTGEGGGKMKALADVLLSAPESKTYRVQEYHLPIYHTLCAAVETYMFGEEE